MGQTPPTDTMPDNKAQKPEKKQIWDVLRRKNHPHTNGGKDEPTPDSARTHEQARPLGTSGNPKASFSVTRRPTASSNKSPEDEDGLERLRSEGRDLVKRLQSDTGGNVNGTRKQPLPIPHEPISRDATVPIHNTDGDLGRPATRPLMEIESSAPTALIPTNYPATAGPTPHLVYTAEPRGIEHGVSPDHLRANDHNTRPSQCVRNVAMPEYEHNLERYPGFGGDATALKQQDGQVGLINNHQKGADAQSLKILQSAHENALQDIKDLRTQLDSLRTAYKGVTSNAAALSEDITDLQEDVSSWRERFDATNNELLQLKAELKSKVDDKWFTTQWSDLHTKIENLSHRYFVGRLVKSTSAMLSRAKGSRVEKVDSQTSKRLTRLTQAHSQYLGSDNERPLIIQAFIWWTLTNKIFDHMNCSDEGLYWAGQARELLCGLKGALRPLRRKDWSQCDPAEAKRMETDTKNFHKWRATTSIMLLLREPATRRTNSIEYLITQIIAEIMDTLSPFVITKKEPQRAIANSDISKQLHTIINSAIQLDAEIHQQRAWIYCEQWTAGRLEGNPLWGFKWDPEDQEMVLGPDQAKGGHTKYVDPCVELVVQPALYRAGNQYGEEYSIRHVLCKAKVVVGENPTYPANRRW